MIRTKEVYLRALDMEADFSNLNKGMNVLAAAENGTNIVPFRIVLRLVRGLLRRRHIVQVRVIIVVGECLTVQGTKYQKDQCHQGMHVSGVCLRHLWYFE